jgi:hypothetical protein
MFKISFKHIYPEVNEYNVVVEYFPLKSITELN